MTWLERPIARLLMFLARFPGDVAELAVGLFAFGWGVVSLANPDMFDVRAGLYAPLHLPFGEAWGVRVSEGVYGVLFSVIGLAQITGAARLRPIALRYGSSLIAAVAFSGLAGAFYAAGAYSEAYVYAYHTLLCLVLAGRLWVVREAQKRGITLPQRRFYESEQTLVPTQTRPDRR